jgi:dUTP pyrophosphatase
MSSYNLYIDCLGDSELSDKYVSAKLNPGDAGVDLYCSEEIVVPAKGQATLDFKIVCKCETYSGNPSPYYLYPRSSISKTPLRMSNSVGIIDAGYRGHIMAKVDNISDTDFVVKAGERYFQICMQSLVSPIVIVGAVNDVTERGAGGFGSTGR